MSNCRNRKSGRYVNCKRQRAAERQCRDNGRFAVCGVRRPLSRMGELRAGPGWPGRGFAAKGRRARGRRAKSIRFIELPQGWAIREDPRSGEWMVVDDMDEPTSFTSPGFIISMGVALDESGAEVRVPSAVRDSGELEEFDNAIYDYGSRVPEYETKIGELDIEEW